MEVWGPSTLVIASSVLGHGPDISSKVKNKLPYLALPTSKTKRHLVSFQFSIVPSERRRCERSKLCTKPSGTWALRSRRPLIFETSVTDGGIVWSPGRIIGELQHRPVGFEATLCHLLKMTVVLWRNSFWFATGPWERLNTWHWTIKLSWNPDSSFWKRHCLTH